MAAPELLFTRKRVSTGSLSSTCGSWQVVHCSMPWLSSFTRSPDGGLVICGFARLGTRPTGWLLARLSEVPARLLGLPAGRACPVVSPWKGTCPLLTVSPRATVPSWQLRQSLEPLPGCGTGVSRVLLW